jgi:hypothetical protein
VRPAALFGIGHSLLGSADSGERDIDVLVLDDGTAAGPPERSSWLGRLARFSDRCIVVLRDTAFDAEYRALLRRAKNNDMRRHEASQEDRNAVQSLRGLPVSSGTPRRIVNPSDQTNGLTSRHLDRSNCIRAQYLTSVPALAPVLGA